MAGTYDLCAAFTDRDFCYPIVAFLLVDVASSLWLALSFILLAVTISPGQKSSAARLCRYSLRAQTFGFCAAVLSSVFAFVAYTVSTVHLQGGQLVAGFSVTGGFANITLSGAGLALPHMSKLLHRKRVQDNPFGDHHAVDPHTVDSQLRGW